MSGKKPCNAATYRAATIELAKLHAPRTIVEVGVFAGDLSRLFADLPSLERLYIVDSWDGAYSDFGQQRMDEVAAGVIAWAGTHPKVSIYRADSLDAAEWFPDGSIDFFHTDGDHSIEGIRGDINAWAPKVRAGGILSGDNYEWPPVAQGVTELLPQHQTGAKGRLWWAVK